MGREWEVNGRKMIEIGSKGRKGNGKGMGRE